MQTNHNYFLFNFLILFTVFFRVHSQNNDEKIILEKKNKNVTDTISQSKDSLADKKKLILDLIKYSAKDSVKINKQKNEIFLYNEAVLEYQDMTLNSGVILLNYLDNEVYAGRIHIQTVQGSLSKSLFLLKVEMKLIQTQLDLTLIRKKP